ncbi:PHP domain-containing protein [uncultured Ruthenibacterium sp.]|uniref:PHP domain-containing protein n=1 Tax=uncultured Ruthenibacterium sp. TaxID=1905347 RepID=UPI00349F04C4
MSALRADLHIHTCLSPCADDDLTPATAAGLAKLAGADLIAITDHNSARNLPAAQIACEAYGLRLLPGIEANTCEEIHLLCYFGKVETALSFSEKLNAFLPSFPYDSSVWGRQLVMDENDCVLDQIPKLLTGALTLSLAETAALCRAMGGIPVPAHADADSYSLFSVLGGWPMDVDFDLMEAKDPEKVSCLIEKGFFPAGKPLLFSSDAHCMQNVACRMCELEETSPLYQLIK